MGFEFVCPIGGAGAGLPPWHAAVHLGLTAIVVTAGAILLVAGIIEFRASAPDRAPLPDRAATGARTSTPTAARRSAAWAMLARTRRAGSDEGLATGRVHVEDRAWPRFGSAGTRARRHHRPRGSAGGRRARR